ncbi:MAG: anti-sigma factor [Pseudomonadota bacterium]
MRIEDPALVDALASEYVLGTLRGRARQRFERLMQQRADVCARVYAWERRLADLAGESATPSVAPPPRVWRRIRQRLAFDNAPVRLAPRRRRRTAPLWQALAASVAAVALTLGTWWTAQQLQPPQVVTLTPTYISVIADAQGAGLWSVQLFETPARLSVRATGEIVPLADEQVYQLWMLPEGGAPRSLGLLPNEGTLESLLSAEALQALARSANLAVSTEPPGGSPTGLPTGEVVYVAALAKS